MASRINFVLPISLRQMEGKTKGKLIRPYGSTYVHSKEVKSSAGMSKSKIRFRHPEKFGLSLRVYNVKIADASMQFLKTSESSSRIALKCL